MKLYKILEGPRATIWAIDLSDTAGTNCPANDFLLSLPPASKKSMLNVFKLYVDKDRYSTSGNSDYCMALLGSMSSKTRKGRESRASLQLVAVSSLLTDSQKVQRSI